MTKMTGKAGRTRRTHSEQFKQELISQCTKPGVSLANVARQHWIHPNLLARWIKERADLPGSVHATLPQFIPVRTASAPYVDFAKAVPPENQIEVNIDRGNLRIAFKIAPSQMIELGQVLREVLQ